MMSFRVGIDSYCLSPLKLSPFEILDWAKRHAADGVQFTEVHLPEGRHVDDALLEDLGRCASENDLYVEWGGGQHIPFDTRTWRRRDLLPINKAAARQARALGTRIIRSCSGGLMRWQDDAPPTETLLRETAKALKAQAPALRDLDVVLAIEIHFEFTTFELLRLFEMCGAEPGGHLGICLDTMNPLTMLEDPVAATERILPWVVAVHAKDGALRLDDDGLVSFPTGAGAGMVDFSRIFDRLSTLDRPVHLSVEDHGGSFQIPIFDPSFLSRFPDLTAAELSRLILLANRGRHRIEAGELAPLDRADWPRVCAARTRDDIVNLKRFVEQAPRAMQSGRR